MVTVTSSSNPVSLADDLLDGVAEIAEFTGIPRRRLYYLENKREIKSLFRLGRRICARKSTLLRELAQRESAGGMRP